MRNRCGFLTIAALSISGAGCGVATDAAIAETLADAVTEAAAEVRLIVDELADAVVADFVVAREVPPDAVTVTLVNNSPSFSIEVTVAYDDHILPLVWLGLGHEETFFLEPGETVSFWKDCDELQTVVIDDADLLIPGSRNRETESDLLNEGLDYECDDEIRFVFDHSDEIRDFDVSIEILGPDGVPHPTLQDSIFDLFDD
ncbi:MAG: hypothetical protein IH989_08590 [Planctomycetes bacterium]|nr:hypothetical protein [Planctomycetota bacterium]